MPNAPAERQARRRQQYRAMQDEIARLRNALASVSLVSQRNDSPSHIIVDECGRIARAALETSST